MKDYYRLLEVDPEASPEVINNAYRALVKKHHPDHYHTSELRKKSGSLMQEINEAYMILSAEEKRREYDRKYSKYQKTLPTMDIANRNRQQIQRVAYWFCLVLFVFLLIRTAGRILFMMGFAKWLVLAGFAYAAYRLWRATSKNK